MITSYIFVLIFSAWLVTALLLRVMLQGASLLQWRSPLPAGSVALLSSMLFLTAVAAPSSMLVGAVMLVVMQLIRRQQLLPPLARFGVPLMAAALTSASLPPMLALGLPPLLLQGFFTALLLACIMAASRLPDSLTTSSAHLLLALLPLLAAPLLVHAPSSIALDIGLMAASLLAAVMGSPASARMGLARMPLALISGWLMLDTATHGGWMLAALSLLIYGGGVAMELTRPSTDSTHAF